MKKQNILKLFILSVLMITTNSCSDLSEINNDPNTASEVPASTLLTYSQFQLFDNITGISLNARWGLLMTQYWSQNEYTTQSRYLVDQTTFDNSWIELNVQVLKELETAKLNLLAKVTAPTDIAQRDNKLAIIEVMKAQTYAILTDSFGDIPYTQGLNEVEYPLPAYDKQEDIYKGLLKTLDDAYKMFDVKSPSFETGDVIYKGDVASWKKFTKSLMLKYAIRIADKDLTTATKYANIAADDLFTSNKDNALFEFGSASDRSNPLWRDVNVDKRDDYCVSELLVKTLEAKSDPRLKKYAKNVSSTITEIIGMPYGLIDNDATVLKNKTSRPSDEVRGAKTPFNVLTYSEVKFFLTEAYQRNILTGDATVAYREAIIASIEQWGVDTANAITYADANPYNASNWKKSIGDEKWTALYMNGLESWSEWRRLDFPVLLAPKAASISQIPTKLPYPLSESQNNSINLGKVTTDPTSIVNKVWWDAN